MHCQKNNNAKYPVYWRVDMSSRKMVYSEKINKNDNLWGIAFVAPWILHFIILMVYPFIISIKTSYFNINVTIPERKQFLGFGNYIELFKDPMFFKSIFNTVYYVIFYIAFILIVGLFFAFLLYEIGRGKVFFRTTYFLPFLISPVVLALLWQALFGEYGPLQQFLIQNHLIKELIRMSNNRWLPMPLLATLNTWKWFGVNTLIFMAGLSSIHKEIIEASQMDGASWLKQVFKIRLPLLKNQIVFCITVNLIGAMQMYAETSLAIDRYGGQYNQMLTPVMHLYNEAFMNMRMGYASTIGIVLSLIIYICTMLQLKITNKD